MKPELALRFAAIAHVGLAAGAALMPVATGLWRETKKLTPFASRLFRIYYAFIWLCLVSSGLGSCFFAAELAAGTMLARAVCGFLAMFWLLRLFAAWALDVRPYLTNGWWRAGYAATNGVFVVLPLLYGWLALRR